MNATRRTTHYVAPESIVGGHTIEIRATVERLRGTILDALPDATEVGYPGWHAIGYRLGKQGRVCAIFPFDDHVQLVLEWGALLHDPDGVLQGETRQTRFLTYGRPEDVDTTVLLPFLLEAATHRGGTSRRTAPA